MEHLETLKISAKNKKEKLAELPEFAPEDVEMREIFEAEYSAFSKESPEHPKRNEDSFFIDSDSAAAGVFDGVGGAKAGNIASEMAAGAVLEELKNAPEKMLPKDWEEYMGSAFLKASREIADAAEKNPELAKGMGTTATVVKLLETPSGKKAIIGNIGDSRAYLWRDSKLTQLTKDDSFVQELIDEKLLPENADQNVNLKIPKKIIDDYLVRISSYKRTYEKKGYLDVGDIRNAITQNLGASKIEPCVTTIDLKEGDKILLCSDGISDNALDKEIADIMDAEETEKNTAEKLADKAAEIERNKTNPRSKPDDKTAIIIKI